MGDAHAEHAPEGLVNPAVAWGTLGAHVVNAKGARGALECGVVSVGSFGEKHTDGPNKTVKKEVCLEGGIILGMPLIGAYICFAKG